jgi:hypothetical protein
VGGKRVTKAIGRRVLESLPAQFATSELQRVCRRLHVSYDTLLRHVEAWGWVRRVGTARTGEAGRPRPILQKTEGGEP